MFSVFHYEKIKTKQTSKLLSDTLRFTVMPHETCNMIELWKWKFSGSCLDEFRCLCVSALHSRVRMMLSSLRTFEWCFSWFSVRQPHLQHCVLCVCCCYMNDEFSATVGDITLNDKWHSVSTQTHTLYTYICVAWRIEWNSCREPV